MGGVEGRQGHIVPLLERNRRSLHVSCSFFPCRAGELASRRRGLQKDLLMMNRIRSSSGTGKEPVVDAKLVEGVARYYSLYPVWHMQQRRLHQTKPSGARLR